MNGYHHILVATDFSETSKYATVFAKDFAQVVGADICVLHVVDCDMPLLAYGTAYLPPSVTSEMEKQGAEKLDLVLRNTEEGQFIVTRVLRKGNPSREIVRYAAKEKFDLIIVGTHGRGALAHVLMGSVAEKVVRHAPCPVLTVRHPEHEFKMP